MEIQQFATSSKTISSSKIVQLTFREKRYFNYFMHESPLTTMIRFMHGIPFKLCNSQEMFDSSFYPKYVASLKKNGKVSTRAVLSHTVTFYCTIGRKNKQLLNFYIDDKILWWYA